MTLAWHVAKHDLRHFRFGIAAWVLLTAAAALYQGLAAGLDSSGAAVGLISMAATAVVVARWILAISLIVIIVQAHALVGTTAWWMTRPIRPGVLLGSRMLLFGVLFVAVPASCDLILMSAHGVPLLDTARVIVQWSLVRSLGVLLVMGAAAATATFAGVALLAGIVAAALVLTLTGLVMLASTQPADNFVEPAHAILAVTSRWPDQTATLAAWVVALCGLGAIVYSRYHRRPLVRAGWMAAATAAAAVAAVSFWPWQLLHAAVTSPSWAARGGPLRLSGPEGQAIFFDNAGVPWAGEGRPRWRTAHARVHITGLPERWYAMAYPVEGILSIDGKSLASAPAPYAVGLAQHGDGEGADTRIAALEQALQVRTINGSRLRDTTAAAPILRLRSTDTPAGGVFGGYHGEFEVGLHQVEVAAVLPVAAGTSFQDGAYRLTVTGVRLTEGGPRLDIQLSDVSSVLDRGPDPQYQIFLRNALTGEALAGEIRTVTPRLPAPEWVLLGRDGYIGMGSGFRAESGVINFPTTTAARLPSARLPGGRFTYDDDPWMRDAELVVVRTVLGGVVRLPVRIERLAVNGGPRP